MASRSQVVYSTPETLTIAALPTLAAATYCVSPTKTNTVNYPDDLIVQLSAGTGTAPTGMQQVSIFAQASFDGGTTWQSGPTSGTTTTDEPSLTLLGTLPIRQLGSVQRKSFSVAGAYGFVPPNIRFVIKNETGVVLTSGSLSVIEAILQSS